MTISQAKQLTLPLFSGETETVPRVQMRPFPQKKVVTTTLTPYEAETLVNDVDAYFNERRMQS